MDSAVTPRLLGYATQSRREFFANHSVASPVSAQCQGAEKTLIQIKEGTDQKP